jgi:hypothetical protein
VSFQAFLQNRTRFSVEKFVLPSPDGQEVVLVVVAATFEAHSGPELRLANDQRKIAAEDTYFGDPTRSSVRYEADVALEKPLVDVLVNGTAFAPRGRPASMVPIRLEVGDIRKDLLVTGDRVWRSGPLGASPSTPESFTALPVIFERAFGGADRTSPDPSKHAAEQRNLVGVGFRGARSENPEIQTEVPNIERPSARMASKSDRPEPAGFGAVSRGWLPRLRYAGTFDQQWLKDRWPLLPGDFNPMYNQCAPEDQQSRTIVGGEPARLVNMTSDGEWQFRLPRLDIPVLLLYDDRRIEIRPRLDTVLIEPDVRRLTLTSRVAWPTTRNRALLREIVVGTVSRGWIRARMNGKRYVSRAGAEPASYYVL